LTQTYSLGDDDNDDNLPLSFVLTLHFALCTVLLAIMAAAPIRTIFRPLAPVLPPISCQKWPFVRNLPVFAANTPFGVFLCGNLGCFPHQSRQAVRNKFGATGKVSILIGQSRMLIGSGSDLPAPPPPQNEIGEKSRFAFVVVRSRVAVSPSATSERQIL